MNTREKPPIGGDLATDYEGRKMSNKLCPFCGSDDCHVFPDISWFSVRCRGCDGEGPVKDTHEEAIAAWNRRYICPDKNGKKVYAGDEVKTAFRGMISLEPVMTIMFGGRPNRRMCFSSDIELIEESEAPND